jgi:hypothetical protein
MEVNGNNCVQFAQLIKWIKVGHGPSTETFNHLRTFQVTTEIVHTASRKCVCKLYIKYINLSTKFGERLLPFGSQSSVLPLLSGNVKGKIYKTIILPVVVYGCETWSLTLREEHRLRVFENRVLRRIFGPKRDEVTVDWRKLHNRELHNMYSSPDIIRQIK